MKSFKEIFELVKSRVSLGVSDTAADLWFKPLEFVAYENETMIINCTDSFIKDLVISKYSDVWKNAFEEVLGFKVAVKFLDTNEKEKFKELNTNYVVKIDPDRETFENFVVGPSNKFAYAAAKAVAEYGSTGSASGGMIYNPLFIYGNSGLGKTHLLNAIANEIRDKKPSVNLIFVHAEAFTNDFIEHIGNKTTAEFHDKYRSADVLIIDDIQVLATKVQTQEEFFHTINDYIINDKQIILSSDRPPKEIETLTDRIRNRIEAGLLADIQPPEFETRVAIVKHKCNAYNIELDDSIINFIAEKVKNNVRQLEGVVKKLKALLEIDEQKVFTINDIQQIVKVINTNSQPVPRLTEKIIYEVSKIYNVSIEDLYSSKRNASISNARQIAMYIIRDVTGMTYEEIGKKFNRNYSTVIHSIQNVEDDLEINSSLKAQVTDIIRNIKDE